MLPIPHVGVWVPFPERAEAREEEECNAAVGSVANQGGSRG
jgi:hypothetical protein